MANKSAADLILAIRQHSNTVNRKVVTDAEVLARANEGLSSLYDLIDGAHGTYFVIPHDFTLVGGNGQNTAPLPTDFYRAKALDRVLSGGELRSVDPLASFAERNNPGRVGYDLEDISNIMVVPPSCAAGAYRLRYIPKCPQLALTVTVQAAATAPGTGVWPDTSKLWLIDTNIQNSLNGTLAPNQKDLMWRWKQSYIASGQWSVVQSSSPTVLGAPGVDMLTSGAQFLRPGGSIGPYSWILLQRRDGVQLCLQISVDVGWTEYVLTCSPSGLFTSGTAGVAPTASDSILIQDTVYGGGSNWLGREGNPGINQQYTMHNWQSTDGTASYTVIIGTNHTQMLLCIFRPVNPVPGWTTPVVTWLIFGGPNQNTGAPVPDIVSAMGSTMFAARAAPGLIKANLTLAGTNASAPAAVLAQWPFADELSGKFLLCRSGLFGTTVGARSESLGFVPDMWWSTASTFQDGGTYTDGAGNSLIYLRQMVLPWKAGVVSLGYTAPGTSGPFYATGV